MGPLPEEFVSICTQNCS